MTDAEYRLESQEDIVVARPIDRDLLRRTSEGFLATCTDDHCDWQGLFPELDLAAEAAERHWNHERRTGDYHFGVNTYHCLELLDRETALFRDTSELSLSVECQRYATRERGVREVEFPRTTGDVSELVSRGDLIYLPAGREQKVRYVTETRSSGLPTWTVCFCDLEDDQSSTNHKFRGQNELIARDGHIYRSYGEDPLAVPAFEVRGVAEHQAGLSQFQEGSA